MDKEYFSQQELWPQPPDKVATLKETPAHTGEYPARKPKKHSGKRRKLTDSVASLVVAAVAVVMVVNAAVPGPGFHPFADLGFDYSITVPEEHPAGTEGTPVSDPTEHTGSTGATSATEGTFDIVNGWHLPEFGGPFDALLSTLLGYLPQEEDYERIHSLTIKYSEWEGCSVSMQLTVNGVSETLEGEIFADLDLTEAQMQALSLDMNRFRKLTYLDFSSSALLEDISFLQSMPEVETLLLYRNSIKDISPIGYCKKLAVLKINHNPIASIPEGLDLNVVTLDLSETELTNVDHISGLLGPATESVEIIYTPLSDLGGFAEATDLTSLKTLGLYWNELETVDGLEGLAGAASLERIDLYGNKITDISALAALKETPIESLSFRDNPLSDISPLAELSGLTELTLENTACTDLQPLKNLTKLEYLTLDGTGVSDISPLSGLTAVKTLYLGNNNISDLTPLSGLTRLNSLHMAGNQVSDLTPLSGCTGLRHLDLQNNLVTDISVLSTLNSLDYLDIRGNAVADLSPVDGLKLSHFIHD